MKIVKSVATILIIATSTLFQGLFPYFEQNEIGLTMEVFAEPEDVWEGVETISVDGNHFDDDFLEYVRDKFGEELTKEEALSLKELHIDNWGGDLSQLEYFPSLEIVDISDYYGYGEGWGKGLRNLRELSLSSDWSWDGVFEEDNAAYDPVLDLKNLDNLESIELENVDIRTLWGNSSLAYISIKKCQNLNKIYLKGSNISSIDLSGVPNLEVLNIERNPVKRLDLSKCTLLKELYCGNTKINKLDLSNNPKLRKLSCVNLNSLKELNLTAQKDLTHLNVADTSIIKLDLSDKTKLRALTVGRDKLAGLDLSNTAITYIGDWWPSDDASASGFCHATSGDKGNHVIEVHADENGMVDIRKINPNFDYSKVVSIYSKQHSNAHYPSTVTLEDEGFRLNGEEYWFYFTYHTGLYKNPEERIYRSLSNQKDDTYSSEHTIEVAVYVPNGGDVGEETNPLDSNDLKEAKYIIGEDTWRFDNYEETITYKDYEKFFTVPVAMLLSQAVKSSARCYGMSQLIPIIKEYGFPENMAGKEINSLWKTGEVRQWIRYAHISQMLPDLVEEEELNRNDYNGLYLAVKNSVEGEGAPVTIALLDNPHQVLPVSILKDTEEEVWFNLYDPNYPDNQLNGEPVYSTFVLHGKNGNYSSCEYLISREIGAEEPIGYISTKDISYTTWASDSFIQAYKNKTKANYWDYQGAHTNASIGRLLYIKGSSSTIGVSDVTNKYPVRIKKGNDNTDSSLFWIRDDDEQISLDNIKPGNEITIASDASSVCIKPSVECSALIKVNDNQAQADFSLRNPGSLEVAFVNEDERVTGVSAIIDVESNSKICFEDGNVSVLGVSSIEVGATSGLVNESGEVYGEIKTFYDNSIDTKEAYSIDIQKLTEKEESKDSCLLTHVYGTWKTTKSSTYTSTGTKERICSVCGYKEHASIPKLIRTSIIKASVNKISNKTYTGRTLKQTPVVKVGNKTLKLGTDYKLSYKNNKKIGKATVTITGIGAYTGTVSKTFLINPTGTSLSKVISAKKGFTAKWKKQATQTTGYQIQYSLNKKFKAGNKTVTVAKNKIASKKIAKLKAKKRYYVRIRTYKTVKGKKYYSAWSKAKAVTTKK